jgi:uncharacterized membrane protein YeaQ/YmgE (transglycosylase-associated protein family)
MTRQQSRVPWLKRLQRRALDRIDAADQRRQSQRVHMRAPMVDMAAIRPPSPQTEEATMTATSLIILLIIGAIAGWLAGLIVRGFGFGLVGNIVVGIIGALLAGWLLPALGVGFTLGNPLVTSIVYALIGAIVLLVIVGLFRRAPHV